MASGHIEKRGKKYQVVLELGYDDQGKRMRKYVQPKVETRALAKKLLAMKIAEIERGEYVDPNAGKTTVKSFLEQWLETKTDIENTTKESYQEVIDTRIVPRIGSIPLNKLTPMHLESFKLDLLKNGRRDGKGGLSSRSVEYTLSILSSALEKAVDWDIILRNPMRKVDMPAKKSDKVPPFTNEQVKKILEFLKDDSMYAAFVVLVATGVRRGELLGLRKKDILWNEKAIRIEQTVVRTKGGYIIKPPKTEESKRKIKVSDNVLNALKEHLKAQNAERLQFKGEYKDHGLVFCRPNGEPINPSTFTSRFIHTILPKVGIEKGKYHLHSFRHTTATLLLARGYSMKQIQKMLGHSTITTTMDIYTDVDPELEQSAALELDDMLFA